MALKRSQLAGIGAVVLSAATATWSLYAPIETYDSSAENSSKNTAVDSSPENLSGSIFDLLSSQQLSASLRPDVSPPVVKPEVVDKDQLVKPPAPIPPLKTRLTLIGTVIESDRSHAVLNGPSNETMVVFLGDQLPSPNGDVILKQVDMDSVTLQKQNQTEVLRIDR